MNEVYIYFIHSGDLREIVRSDRPLDDRRLAEIALQDWLRKGEGMMLAPVMKICQIIGGHETEGILGRTDALLDVMNEPFLAAQMRNAVKALYGADIDEFR